MDIEQIKNLSQEEKDELKKILILRPLESKEELRAWVYLFFDILFPMGVVYPTSTHGPIEAMWRIYELMKTGESKDVPEVVMLSARDSYKCQAKGSKLLSRNGLINIEDATIGQEVWSGWNWKKITDWIDDGKKDGIELTLRNGTKLTSTPIHRYWALRDGTEQWIRAVDLEEGDLVCQNTNTPFKNFCKKDIDQEEFDIGYFLGLIVGDGGVTYLEKKGSRAFFTLTTIDENTKKFFLDFVENKIGTTWSLGTDKITYRVSTAKGVSYAKKLGLSAKYSFEKTIPSYCYTNLSAMVGFISGVFDSDGTVSSANEWEIPLTSEELLMEMHYVLMSFGIYSKFRSNTKLYCNQNHVVHHLLVGANDYPDLLKIGCKFTAKKAQEMVAAKIYDAHNTISMEHAEKYIETFSGSPRLRGRKLLRPKLNVKDYENVTYGKLQELADWQEENVQNGRYDEPYRVRALGSLKSMISNKWMPFTKKRVENVHFYDLTVEDDHSYWSNGSISHNTLSAAALEVLCLIHFRFSIAHAAAIMSQSEKAVSYVNTFFRKIQPHLEFHGWKKTSDSKTKVEWLTEEQENIYLRVLVMTRKGMNSEHLPMLFLDELDLVQDPGAVEESKMVPSIYKKYFPLTVSLSTRKYKGGQMEKKIKEALNAGGELLRWNIIDVCERITPEQAEVDKPKVKRYISRELPMENILPEEWGKLPDEIKNKYEEFEAYAGIATHPMLSVMKNYLVDRPQSDAGFLYKPVSAVRNNFKQVSPDMGEAQLLCNKPSSKGLVYPRFTEKNIITVREALAKISGEDLGTDSFEYLKQYIKDLGIPIIGGADWGFSDHTSLVLIALLPGGETILLDNMSMPGLELDDIVKYMTEMQREWGVDKWYVDQAYPAYIKTLRKKGLKVPKFKKVVEDGISALQGRIVDSSNVRRFFVLKTPNNKNVTDAFDEYRWKTDGKGDIIEGKPHHDKEGVSDVMDSIRYPFQNLFNKGGRPVITGAGGGTTESNANSALVKAVKEAKDLEEAAKEVNAAIMKSKVGELAGAGGGGGGIKKKGKIFWG